MNAEYERRKANYDQVLFRIKKGKAEEYRQAAQDLGMGFWELIQFGIEEFIANHAGEEFKPAPAVDTNDTQKLSAQEKKLVEEFAKLPVDTQKAIAKLIQAINQNQAANMPE